MVILLTGSNEFGIHNALTGLVKRFLSKHGSHALERVDGETLEPTRLPELLQGMSLFAAQRLVVLRDAGKNKPLWEALGEWAERVPAETTLVIVEPTPDKRTRTYKQLQKNGKLQEFAELREPELAKWAQTTAAALEGSLDAKAAAYLVQQSGTNQWLLLRELEKLINYTPTITVETIDLLVEPTPQAGAFELLDSVLNHNARKTSQLLAQLKTIEEPYKLFGLLVSQVHTLALVVSAQGKSPDVIAKEASVHPFVVRKMQPLARGTSYGQLQEVIALVAQTDRQLKSSGVDPWLLLEQCLSKIVAQVR